ncbi:MAG: hypothetical protein IJQ05_04835 [Bacteroidaceae bacterium]|nr:hypothetical protein [Bacteroidaceae bacterium]
MFLEVVSHVVLAGSNLSVEVQNEDFDDDKMTPLARDNNYSVWDEKWGEGE